MRRGAKAGSLRRTAMPTFRSRICRSACSRRAGGGRARRRRDRRRDFRSRRGARARAVRWRLRRRRRRPRPAPRSMRCSRSARDARAGLAARRSARFSTPTAGPCPQRGARARGSFIAPRLPPATSGGDRRLHRFLRRHPSRDQCRHAVPARQSAAAELQIRSDRLSRPRVVDRCLGRAGAPPERPAQSAAAKRSPSLRALAATSTMNSSLACGSGPATSSARRSRSRRRRSHIAGFCLLNDWSARDIQAWEYQPLGPFLAKNFHHDDLAVGGHARGAGAVPHRRKRARPAGDPAPLPYLADAADQASGALDIELEVLVADAGACRQGAAAAPASLPATHATSIGPSRSWSRITPAAAAICGRATSSGPARSRRRKTTGSAACSRSPTAAASRSRWRRAKPARFLEDGDTVIMRAHCRREGFASIGFGECRGTITAAPPV